MDGERKILARKEPCVRDTLRRVKLDSELPNAMQASLDGIVSKWASLCVWWWYANVLLEHGCATITQSLRVLRFKLAVCSSKRRTFAPSCEFEFELELELARAGAREA